MTSVAGMNEMKDRIAQWFFTFYEHGPQYEAHFVSWIVHIHTHTYIYKYKNKLKKLSIKEFYDPIMHHMPSLKNLELD